MQSISSLTATRTPSSTEIGVPGERNQDGSQLSQYFSMKPSSDLLGSKKKIM